MGAANLISSAAAKRYEAVPVQFIGDRGLLVAMADPANVLAVDDIALMTGYEVRPAVASREDITALVARLTRLDDVVQSASFEEEEESGAEVVELRESAEDAPVIKLVNWIIAQAVEQGASDIHLSPDGQELRVRFRIDGVLMDSATVPAAHGRRRHQPREDHGRPRHRRAARAAGRPRRADHRRPPRRPARRHAAQRARRVDRHAHPRQVRAASSSSTSSACADGERERFEKAFRQAYGAVLVTGPTGSGKSTTLYAALGEVNTPEKNIITIEDPVEYQIDGHHPGPGQRAGRPDLRQRAARDDARRPRHHHGRRDPRPRDGADRHRGARSPATSSSPRCTPTTRRAPSRRLIEMGIEPFLVASAAGLRRRPAPGAHALPALQARARSSPPRSCATTASRRMADVEAYEPVGCARCGGSGYKGASASTR